MVVCGWGLGVKMQFMAASVAGWDGWCQKMYVWAWQGVAVGVARNNRSHGNV